MMPQSTQNDGSSSIFIKQDLFRVLVRLIYMSRHVSSPTSKNQENEANTEKKEWEILLLWKERKMDIGGELIASPMVIMFSISVDEGTLGPAYHEHVMSPWVHWGASTSLLQIEPSSYDESLSSVLLNLTLLTSFRKKSRRNANISV